MNRIKWSSVCCSNLIRFENKGLLHKLYNVCIPLLYICLISFPYIQLPSGLSYFNHFKIIFTLHLIYYPKCQYRVRITGWRQWRRHPKISGYWENFYPLLFRSNFLSLWCWVCHLYTILLQSVAKSIYSYFGGNLSFGRKKNHNI